MASLSGREKVITDDLAEIGQQRLRPLGRYGIPDGQIGVIDALLCIQVLAQDIFRHTMAYRAILR